MSGTKVYLTIFTWGGIRGQIGPQIEAKTRAEAEIICEGLGCKIVRELTNVIVAGDDSATPY